MIVRAPDQFGKFAEQSSVSVRSAVEHDRSFTTDILVINRSTLPFLGWLLVALLIITWWPGLSLWLVERMQRSRELEARMQAARALPRDARYWADDQPGIYRMSATDCIETWDDDRGLGSIAPTGGGQDVFLHISAFPDDPRGPVDGDAVRYELR